MACWISRLESPGLTLAPSRKRAWRHRRLRAALPSGLSARTGHAPLRAWAYSGGTSGGYGARLPAFGRTRMRGMPAGLCACVATALPPLLLAVFG